MSCCRNGNVGRPDSATDSAITLAAELGKQQANILVLTDHKPADEKISSQRLEWHAFGLPLDNFAFVNASRTAFGDQDRCLLEIANFSGGTRSARLVVQAGSNAPQTSALLLGAHESQRLVFNIPSTAPSLHAALDDDPLAEDNEVQLLPPVRKRVRVQTMLTNENLSALVNRTLDATGLRAAISAESQLVIHCIRHCRRQQFLDFELADIRRYERIRRTIPCGRFASTRVGHCPGRCHRRPRRPPIRPATCR